MPLAVATHGRTPPAAGVALIKSFESCARKRADGLFEAYPDPGQPNGLPWTIGWGSTGAGIARDSVWTQQQCDDRLTADAQRYLDEVLAAIGPAPTTENQLAALLSFHYNTGAIRTATLTQRHIAGDYAGAAEAFMWWDKSGGRVMAGLQRRRRAEADLYLTP